MKIAFARYANQLERTLHVPGGGGIEGVVPPRPGFTNADPCFGLKNGYAAAT
jgi:hypothetical protein